MPNIPKNLVPARYIGNHAVELGPGLVYYSIDGTRRKSNSLEPGDTMMMRDEDVFGKTIWHDPQRQKSSVLVGLGRVVMDKEHLEMSSEELAQFGYEFHEGRSDFEPLEPIPQSKRITIPDSIKAEEVVAEGDEEHIIKTPEPDKNEEKLSDKQDEQATESEENQ